MGSLLPRESSGFLAQSGVPDPDPIPADDKNLVFWGKASKVRGDAVAPCLVYCLLRGTEGLPQSL